MSIPVISFYTLCNYCKSLQAGTVVERSSLQTLFGRISDYLQADHADEELTLTISTMTRNPDGSIRGLASNDETYLLNDTQSATINHLTLKDANGNILRSLVLGLSDVVSKELFGAVVGEQVYACKVDGGMLSELCVGSSNYTNPHWSYDIEPVLHMHADGSWSMITGVEKCENSDDAKFIMRPATKEELDVEGIGEFPKFIPIVHTPNSGVVSRFTDKNNVWQVITGVKQELVNGVPRYALAYRTAVGDEVPITEVANSKTVKVEPTKADSK